MKWLAALLCMISSPAMAGLDQAALNQVTFAPRAGVGLPLATTVHEAGRAFPLRQIFGKRPALLIPVDYKCRTTCGPALAIASAALTQTGLTAGADYEFILLGLNPESRSEDAATFTRARIGDDALERATQKLTADAAALRAITDALGYQYDWDSETASYAHPIGAVTLTAQGAISRLLSPLALDPQDLRLALLEAGEGHVGSWADRVALLCYGFDAAHGLYTSRIVWLLQIAGAITLILMAAWLYGLKRHPSMHGGGP